LRSGRNGPLQSTRTAKTGVGTPGRGHRQPRTLAGKGWAPWAPADGAQDPCRAYACETSGTPESPKKVDGGTRGARGAALALEGAPARQCGCRCLVRGRIAPPGGLEGNVVVGDALMEILGWRRGGCSWRTLRGTGHRYRPLIIAGALRGSVAATAAATQQDQALGFADHLGHVFLLAFFVFPTAGFETALQVDLLPFEQETGDILRTPHGDVVPVRDVFPFAGLLVFGTTIGGQGELGNRNSAGGEFGLGIFAKMTDQNDFVDASRCHLILNCITPKGVAAIAAELDIPAVIWDIKVYNSIVELKRGPLGP